MSSPSKAHEDINFKKENLLKYELNESSSDDDNNSRENEILLEPLSGNLRVVAKSENDEILNAYTANPEFDSTILENKNQSRSKRTSTKRKRLSKKKPKTRIKKRRVIKKKTRKSSKRRVGKSNTKSKRKSITKRKASSRKSRNKLSAYKDSCFDIIRQRIAKKLGICAVKKSPFGLPTFRRTSSGNKAKSSTSNSFDYSALKEKAGIAKVSLCGNEPTHIQPIPNFFTSSSSYENCIDSFSVVSNASALQSVLRKKITSTEAAKILKGTKTKSPPKKSCTETNSNTETAPDILGSILNSQANMLSTISDKFNTSESLSETQHASNNTSDNNNNSSKHLQEKKINLDLGATMGEKSHEDVQINRDEVIPFDSAAIKSTSKNNDEANLMSDRSPNNNISSDAINQETECNNNHHIKTSQSQIHQESKSNINYDIEQNKRTRKKRCKHGRLIVKDPKKKLEAKIEKQYGLCLNDSITEEAKKIAEAFAKDRSQSPVIKEKHDIHERLMNLADNSLSPTALQRDKLASDDESSALNMKQDKGRKRHSRSRRKKKGRDRKVPRSISRSRSRSRSKSQSRSRHRVTRRTRSRDRSLSPSRDRGESRRYYSRKDYAKSSSDRNRSKSKSYHQNYDLDKYDNYDDNYRRNDYSSKSHRYENIRKLRDHSPDQHRGLDRSQTYRGRSRSSSLPRSPKHNRGDRRRNENKSRDEIKQLDSAINQTRKFGIESRFPVKVNEEDTSPSIMHEKSEKLVKTSTEQQAKNYSSPPLDIILEQKSIFKDAEPFSHIDRSIVEQDSSVAKSFISMHDSSKSSQTPTMDETDSVNQSRFNRVQNHCSPSYSNDSDDIYEPGSLVGPISEAGSPPPKEQTVIRKPSIQVETLIKQLKHLDQNIIESNSDANKNLIHELTALTDCVSDGKISSIAAKFGNSCGDMSKDTEATIASLCAHLLKIITQRTHQKPNIPKPHSPPQVEDDEVPSSAVELNHKEKYLQKLSRQERVIEEVKLALKPYYQGRTITKEDYKEILRRAVPRICHSKDGEINVSKIQSLVEKYVQRFKS